MNSLQASYASRRLSHQVEQQAPGNAALERDLLFGIGAPDRQQGVAGAAHVPGPGWSSDGATPG